MIPFSSVLKKMATLFYYFCTLLFTYLYDGPFSHYIFSEVDVKPLCSSSSSIEYFCGFRTMLISITFHFRLNQTLALCSIDKR